MSAPTTKEECMQRLADVLWNMRQDRISGSFASNHEALRKAARDARSLRRRVRDLERDVSAERGWKEARERMIEELEAERAEIIRLGDAMADAMYENAHPDVTNSYDDTRDAWRARRGGA